MSRTAISHETLDPETEVFRQRISQLETELCRAERELASSREALERTQADFEQFAHSASHDMTAPIRIIAGYCQILQHRLAGKLDAKCEEYLKNIGAGVTGIYALLDDLLEFARVTRSSEALRPTAVNDVVKQALAQLKSAIDQSGAEVTYGELPTVGADRGQLARLFEKLLGNAIKYRAERPLKIRIAAEDQGHEWRFAVQDNGIGIEPKYFERIFVIFQRLHSQAEIPGTGAGLAVCKRIVERHGGRIWVESTPAVGSTFFFTLAKR